MSILNVNTIQPVGSGQTITVSATNISAPSTVVTASSFVGNVTATTISGVSTAGITTAYVAQLGGVGIGTSIQVASGSKLVGLTTGSVYAPGTIVQVRNSTLTTQVNNATDSWASAGFNLTITPQSASNYFYVIFEGAVSKNTSAGGGFGLQIYRNGVSVTPSGTDSVDRPFDIYKDETRIFTRSTRTYYAQTGVTTSTTFDLYFKRYDSSSGTVVLNYTSETRATSTLTVMEIAG